MTYRMAVVHRRDYLSEELPRLDLLELGFADNVLCKAGSPRVRLYIARCGLLLAFPGDKTTRERINGPNERTSMEYSQFEMWRVQVTECE
jgi:hypothetical protein